MDLPLEVRRAQWLEVAYRFDSAPLLVRAELASYLAAHDDDYLRGLAHSLMVEPRTVHPAHRAKEIN